MSQEQDSIINDVEILVKVKPHWLTSLANTAALLYTKMPDISWVGFYLLHENELILGPFQGKIACAYIKIGQGVCGIAFLKRETLVVPNVHEFPGHIACDPASCSEIVVPLKKGERTLGVLDIDSTSYFRFTDKDRKMLETIASMLTMYCNIEEFVDC